MELKLRNPAMRNNQAEEMMHFPVFLFIMQSSFWIGQKVVSFLNGKCFIKFILDDFLFI